MLIFQGELNKFSKNIAIKGKRLNCLNKKLEIQSPDIYIDSLNEAYKAYQNDLNYNPAISTFNTNTTEFITKNALKDLNKTKILDFSQESIGQFRNFSLSTIIRANHRDRIMTLLSVGKLRDEIKRKREILQILKKDDNYDCELLSRVGENAKVLALKREIKIVEEKRSSRRKDISQMMVDAQSLKTQIDSFNSNIDLVLLIKRLVNEDSKEILNAIKMCHNKVNEINHQVQAVKVVIVSIKNMFEGSLESVKTITKVLHDRQSAMSYRLDYFGALHDQSKMYYIIIDLLTSYRDKNELTQIRDQIESTNQDYKEESTSIAQYCGKTRTYMPRLNDKIAFVLDKINNVETETSEILSRLYCVLNEW